MKKAFIFMGLPLSGSDISALPHNAKEKVKHSTQKPLKLIERIVQIGTNEGDLILDNCSGSGTLAIECIKNNREWIMIEQKEEYYNLSLKRVGDFLNSFSQGDSNKDEK